MTQNNKYRTSPYPLFFASNLICILLHLNALFAQVRSNVVMLRPKIAEILVQLQSLKACSQRTYGSDYIELYKPNSNKSIDISYFIIGFNDNFSAQFNGSLRFSLGAKIGPFDFLSIGVSNSGVDIILTTFCSNPRLNMGNYRCSLQDGKRYIILYDNIGISFDAV